MNWDENPIKRSPWVNCLFSKLCFRYHKGILFLAVHYATRYRVPNSVFDYMYTASPTFSIRNTTVILLFGIYQWITANSLGFSLGCLWCRVLCPLYRDWCSVISPEFHQINFNFLKNTLDSFNGSTNTGWKYWFIFNCWWWHFCGC